MAETNSKRQDIVDEAGEKKFVVLPIDDYEQILEDVRDLAAIAERRDEPRISLDTLENDLKADGLL